MADTTNISWTDKTFNPWIGCTKVSPGCLNCYAATDTFARVKRGQGVELWGKGKPRHRTSEAYWKDPIKWNNDASGPLQSFQQVEMKDGRIYRGTIPEISKLELLTSEMIACGPARPRVFCASLSDWLDDEVPIEWLADLLELIWNTPNLDWLLLTKRPENWEKRMRQARKSTASMAWVDAWIHASIQPCPSLVHPPPAIPENVWIGTTVENQAMADKRIPELLKIPAKVRFLSCEPLLEALDLKSAYVHPSITDKPDISWIIVGGESGAGFRPFDPQWARSIREQTYRMGAAFHMKQMGGLKPSMMPPIPADLMIREFPEMR